MMHSQESHYVTANGIRIHYLRQGRGSPMVLLHGWPEFCHVWWKCLPGLSAQYDVVAPDLRGFGETEKPAVGPNPNATAETHAEDLRALADLLGFERFGLVSGDVGAYVAQAFARKYPDRLTGLFFFCCPYPGLGRRYGEPGHLIEVWYQYFNQLPRAAELVGSSREACRIFFKHFLDHWSGDNPSVFADELEAYIDNFMKPGNIQGGFDWYVSSAPNRRAWLEEKLPPAPRITVPARHLWGRRDPIIKPEWSDRLDEYFTDYSIEFVDAGHFVHYERPDLAVSEILRFFEGRVIGASDRAGEVTD
jgi:pimeloyl-ACP methyl ester carboxylesterase